ncbi:MAG TPA: DUF3043 domain-containing protein [Micromonosporaceae bacterium]|nr:DUF3043 domain-containing protein [Micromonosporaceae bacterium]
MPSLFRRRSTADAASPEPPAATGADSTEAAPNEAGLTGAGRSKGYTPSKRELGVTTPKRTTTDPRRKVEPAPTNRREAYRRQRARMREQRREAAEGMRRGDEQYLLPRDKGPERALVRDIVDARRTAGTWFFAGALIVILGSSRAMPVPVQLASNVLWVVLALAVVIDSVLIALKIKRLVRERFPRTTQRMGSLYLYGILRGITFRRMRMPKPRVKLGAAL